MDTGTRTRTRSAFETTLQDSLQSAVGQLVARATPAEGARASQLWRWLLAAGAVFVAWRVLRNLRTLFWMLFGLAMAAFWGGLWRIG